MPPFPALQNDLLMMASLCERNLRNSLGCLLNRDEDLCNVIIADDEEIDQLEKHVDKYGIDLLRRFQPVASDLRHVIAAMKLSSNLERIADQAVNIARKARKLNRAPLVSEVNFSIRCIARLPPCSATSSALTLSRISISLSASLPGTSSSTR